MTGLLSSEGGVRGIERHFSYFFLIILIFFFFRRMLQKESCSWYLDWDRIGTFHDSSICPASDRFDEHSVLSEVVQSV